MQAETGIKAKLVSQATFEAIENTLVFGLLCWSSLNKKMEKLKTAKIR